MILEEVIDEIDGYLKEVLTYLGLKHLQISYDITESPLPEFGDYSTNISFQLAKILHKSPISIAKEIVKGKLELCNRWKNRQYIESVGYEKGPGRNTWSMWLDGQMPLAWLSHSACALTRARRRSRGAPRCARGSRGNSSPP